MGEKLIVGPINKGIRTDREPFNIDNDSFPQLINAYQWRGRIKRKRGTSQLGRLQRFLGTTNGSGNLTVTIAPQPIASGIITVTIGTDIFVDQGGASPVTMITNSSGSAILNRSTGVLTITGSKINTTVIYNPGLPVMGLEELSLTSTQNPGTLGFDTDYSYNISTNNPFNIYDVSFYKNPATGAYPGYVQKSSWTPTWWNGANYQQFWTVNYEGALWATNGIDVPFTGSTIGMQFKRIAQIGIIAAGPPAILSVQIIGHGLVVGDFIFVNEANASITGLNFQTGYVIAVVDVDHVQVEFPNATIGGGPYTPNSAIAQYLTSRSDTTKDCLRWYDGDPTNGIAPYSTLVPGNGWVNFMPPLSENNFSISDLPLAQYYLVGSRLIFPYKDRLLFFGPVIQSSTGSPIYLQDTIIYSQNGTPYYTCSFTGDPVSSTTVFTPLLVPVNQTATAGAYFEDQTGFGGFISAGISQPILTVSPNRDVLIVGFNNLQTKVVYSGNDIVPFSFYIINSELGSGSTFSSITLDMGVLTRGSRGFTITNEVGAERFDLEVIDEAFEVNLNANGAERVTAQRDFINEWVYFTFLSDQSDTSIYTFPNQTLLYNYRDLSFGVFNESYTTYGQFKPSSQLTWANSVNSIKSWKGWNTPWNTGQSQAFQPLVIGGNQQGFIMIREDETDEGNSLAIQNISGDIITSPNHGLNNGDYIIINSVTGSIGASISGQIFSVGNATQNTFVLIGPNAENISGTYQGSGFITRMYVPFIQTKQFPTSWGMSRKTRLGPQQYLLTRTDLGQISLLIFLSQDATNSYNNSAEVPDPTSVNDSLIYSTVLFTCPESTNLGLTPANSNLQMLTSISSDNSSSNTQAQIWHRMNTSLIGDTVQLGFTMSDSQMRAFVSTSETFTIFGATKAYPCLLSTIGALVSAGDMIQISNVPGMTELNGNIYQVVSTGLNFVTINVDSTSFTTYGSGNGIATVMEYPNQFGEIELHGFILDVSPSQMLS